jgi:NosR/NirI family transcriptional regulator, nitrous oxide reductase regulator
MKTRNRRRLIALIVFVVLAGAFSIRLVLTELHAQTAIPEETLNRVLPEATVFHQRSEFVWEGFRSLEQSNEAVGYIFLADNSRVSPEQAGSGLLIGVDRSRMIRGMLMLGANGEPLYENRNLLEEVLPGCTAYHLDEQVPLMISSYALGSDAKLILYGHAFLSREAAPKVQGYAGPISLLVGMDLEGKVTGVSLLAHKETPGYAEEITSPKFLRQFAGKRLGDRFETGVDVDAIARATISSQAVADSIREAMQAKAPELIEGYSETPSVRSLVNLDWKSVVTIIWVIISFVLLLFALKSGARTWIRRTIQIGSLLMIGVVGVTYITSLHFGSFLLTQPPPVMQALALYAVLAFALITALFWGRAYCGYMCPLGTLFDLAGYLLPRRFILRAGTDRALKWVKRIMLVAALALALGLGSVAVLKYEVFDTVFLLDGSLVAVLLAVVVLVLSVPFGRFYCRYLCGVGVCLGTLSNYSFARIKLARECDRCGSCAGVCPVGAIDITEKGSVIDAVECIRCGDCTRTCQHVRKSRASIWR